MKEEAQLAAILCASPLGMALLDDQLRVVRANDAMRRIAGPAAPGSSLADASPQLANELDPLCRSVLKTGKSVIEQEICEQTAPPRCWLATLYRVRGRKPGLTLILSDRTNARAAEDRAREAHLLETIARLAGGLAHDLNNLLVGIMGGASLALDELPEGHPAREHLEFVINSGDRAAELARQLLACSGKGGLFRSRVDVAAIVRETCAGLRSWIPSSVRMELKIEPRLPALLADAEQIERIVRSLVLNAVEAIGGKQGTVRVSAGIVRIDAHQINELDRGRYIVLEISDTGCGMDCNTRNRIFDPFFTTKFTGRGLGLAAVHGIVRSLNGSIRVSSSPGQGSTFTVLLKAPAHAAAAAASHDPSR